MNPSQRSRMTAWLSLFVLFLFATLSTSTAQAQSAAKYGADFLSGGVGARALGMGGAQVALAKDVNAGYWNPAGLSQLGSPELAYMHAERFAGIVSFDYGSVALPITGQSSIGISFFRSGVNDIKNTLNAWDVERDQPKARAETFFETFSAADNAFFLSYSRALGDRFALGVTGKIIRRTIGDFADAWGYSFDVGMQYRTQRFVFGVNLQDASTMRQNWSINRAAFEIDDINPETDQPYTFEEVFEQDLPAGGSFLVLPVARLGSGVILPVGNGNTFTVGMDLDMAFDGQQANVFNAGDVSFHPRIGTEFNLKNVVALRAGINRVTNSERYGLDITPSVGAGLRIKQVALDYGFGDFGGLASDLGYSHRISVQLSLERPGSERTEN
ncbi:MAG TPA: PorV/PorQ family protein [Rhodothermales bacterium]|nr:PorV/PorQ family protein [Rhodothermales bacterium]